MGEKKDWRGGGGCKRKKGMKESPLLLETDRSLLYCLCT